MALTPYKNNQNQLNRSRSSSCSSPIRNRIVYQEIYSMGTNTLVKSYSYDKVFDKDENGRMFQTTQIHVSSFITPEKKVHHDHVKEEKERKEPRRLAVNFGVDKPEMAKKKTNSERQSKFTTTSMKRTAALILFTATNACAFYYFMKYRECSYVWDLKKTESELAENVFGQNQALLKIYSVLKAFNSSSDLHIMVFTGGVGVGKTYSSSIISHNFPWSSSKLLMYSEYFPAEVKNLLSQEPLVCGGNLIIIDDLTVKATKDAIGLIKFLNSKRNENENFLIILIFKFLTEEEKNEILGDFKNSYLNFDHVPFKPLTEDVIRKCFTVEMQRLGVKIPEGELRKLVKERMRHIDVVQGPSGCKGVTEDVASYFQRSTN